MHAYRCLAQCNRLVAVLFTMTFMLEIYIFLLVFTTQETIFTNPETLFTHPKKIFRTPETILTNKNSEIRYQRNVTNTNHGKYKSEIRIVAQTHTHDQVSVYRGLSYQKNFKYPLDVDMVKLADAVLSNNYHNISKINPHPFTYVSLPKTACSFSTNLSSSLVIIVKSEIHNFERRKVIRETWGEMANNLGISVVFLLGIRSISVHTEQNQYGDIIQEDCLDVYKNNTIKTIMGFNWAVKYCSKIKFLMFVDDDYIVNVGNLFSLLRQFKYHKYVYVGRLAANAVPYRNSGSKWDISWNDYPFDTWPPYVMGGAYIVCFETARRFQAVFPYIKSINIDDAYLGIVARKLNINPINSKRFHAGRKGKNPFSRNLVASHGFGNPKEVKQLWILQKQKQNTR